MRFLVSALGSAGDVHPFIAVSQALIARGHGVRMIASPYFEARIRRAGIQFVALGTSADYEGLVARPDLWDSRRGARYILDELLNRLPEAYAVTDAAARATDTVMVGSTLSWATRLVQERRGIPAATVHLSPVCLQSATDPSVIPGVGDLSWMPTPALRWLQERGERLVLDRFIGPRLNAMRAALGLAPVDRIWSRWIHSPQLVVGAWPAWFAPVQPDWPPRTETSGFPVYDEGRAALDRSLAAFLDAGPAPIGVTPGSAMAHGERFFSRALDACRALERRVVLITAYREQLPARLPAWAHHTAWAPFSALMPRLSALVHHGGIGTSAQALAAGIPQAVVPFAHDQFDNAARLRRLGVSRTLAIGGSADRWRAALRDLHGDPATASAVRREAARMAAAEPAADVIAARLEALGRLQGSTAARTAAPR